MTVNIKKRVLEVIEEGWTMFEFKVVMILLIGNAYSETVYMTEESF